MKRSFLEQAFEPHRRIWRGEDGSEVLIAKQIGIHGLRRGGLVVRLDPRIARHSRASRFLLEDLGSALQLGHPHLASVVDLGQDDYGYYVVHEAMRGDLLQCFLDRREGQPTILVEDTVLIARQILEALRHAHRFIDDGGVPRHLAHGALGPHRILLSPEGTASVFGFGWSRAERCVAAEWEEAPPYFRFLAPEVLRGEPADARSDIYGLSAIFYELAVGPLFGPKINADDLVHGGPRTPTPPTFARTDFPADLETLIMRGLEWEPNDRFDSAEQMVEALERLAFDQGMRLSSLRLSQFFVGRLGMGETAAADMQSPNSEDLNDDEILGDELNFDRSDLFNKTEAAAPKIDTQVIKADQVEDVEELSSEALLEDEEATGRTLAPVADEIELDVDEIDFDVSLPEPLAALGPEPASEVIKEGRRTSPFLDYSDDDGDFELSDAIASVSAELEALQANAGHPIAFTEPAAFMQLGASPAGPAHGDEVQRAWSYLDKVLK